MIKNATPHPGKPRVVVIIPALNEAKSISRVLAALPEHCCTTVIVVDNGSTDNTAEVAAAHKAVVISESRRGYGWACLAGMRAAATHDPEIIVFIDADFSDFPEEITALLTPIAMGMADFVVGSRVAGVRERGALLPQARFGNWLATLLIRLFWGFRYTDLGPFRAIRWSALQELGMQDKTYGWTVEMQIKALQYGLRVAEIPVRYRQRIGHSKVTGTISGTLKAGYKILWTIFHYGFIARRQPIRGRHFCDERVRADA